MSRPRAVPAVVALVVLALAGCGGGDGGDPRAFAVRADRVCAGLTTAVRDLRDGLLRTSASDGPTGLARAMRRYASTTDGLADALGRASPPTDERAFRDATVRGLRRHAGAMRRAATQVRSGEAADALRDELRGAGLPTVPRSLLEDAPACRRATG